MKVTIIRMKAALPRALLAKLLVVCAGIGFSLAVTAQTPSAQTKDHGSHGNSPAAAGGAPAKLSIPDAEVLDQNGRKRKFYTDLVKDKVVVINFVFTSCRTFCPMLGASFSRLQTQLGARLGQDVFLISVSTDPETDSPEKLKAWGAQFKAKPGWTLITGQKDEVEELLRVLTGDGLNKGFHAPSLLIVNDVKKNHRRVYGLEEPAQVVKLTDELAN